ncbi:MAG: YciI family protein [Pirellulales bacterium]
MKVMVIVKASASSEAGEMPSTELLTAMGKFNEELVAAGIMLDGAGLTPSSRGARVRFSGDQRLVINGPFAETKELVAGFWVWQVKSLAEAIEWVKKCPNPMLGESEIEIRPYLEVEDFGAALTSELREQEAVLRARTLGLAPPTFQHSGPLVIGGLNRSYTLETRGQIPQQWESFVPRAGELPAANRENYYGLCWSCRPDGSFDYLAGIEVTTAEGLPSDLVAVPLTERRYAVFPHLDHVSQISRTIELIWTKWVPDCGLSIAQAPCFERYTRDFQPQTGTGGMELWIPLES